MEPIPDQESVIGTSGPERTKRLFNPVIKDLSALFKAAGKTKEEIDALWLEFSKVVYIGDQVDLTASAELPALPGTGTFTLQCEDDVLSWQPVSTDCPTP